MTHENHTSQQAPLLPSRDVLEERLKTEGFFGTQRARILAAFDLLEGAIKSARAEKRG